MNRPAMQNLRDKLLKAGLVTEEQTKQREEPKPPARGNGYQVPIVRAPASSFVPPLPPLAGSKAHQRLEALKQHEVDEQLRSLVQSGQVALEPGDRVFYFQTRKGKLRRLDLSATQASQLEKGELAVVERQEPALIEHSLVPAEIAERMFALFPRSVRFFNRAGAPVGFVPEMDVESTGEEAG